MRSVLIVVGQNIVIVIVIVTPHSWALRAEAETKCHDGLTDKGKM
jgi:hypothetical protein